MVWSGALNCKEAARALYRSAESSVKHRIAVPASTDTLFAHRSTDFERVAHAVPTFALSVVHRQDRHLARTAANRDHAQRACLERRLQAVVGGLTDHNLIRFDELLEP